MMFLPLITALALATGAPAEGDVGPFVRAIWLVQQYGTVEAVDPANDRRVKGALFKALGKDGSITFAHLESFIASETFAKIAGSDGRVQPEEVKNALDAAAPESRKRLLPQVRDHAAFLTTSFDMIDAEHRTSSAALADWIVKNYQPGRHLDVIAVCTANSRRSLFGATMGNIAADYYGIPEIRFHSGGTAASAINARAINALKAIGVEIEPTGKEAPRGEPQTKNPIFAVRWGKAGAPGIPPAEANEFSKVYTDPANPQGGFAALVVCAEADTACPIVRGADVRISAPFLDAKMYDDGSYEAAKYAERRDDIGRFMLSVMLQAKVKLAQRASRTASVGVGR
jgi:arsenate reductase (thioredoxin)